MSGEQGVGEWVTGQEKRTCKGHVLLSKRTRRERECVCVCVCVSLTCDDGGRGQQSSHNLKFGSNLGCMFEGFRAELVGIR